MPAMPRSNKKAEKIAFAILGTPPNLRKPKKTMPEDVKVEGRLNFEESSNFSAGGY